MILQLSTTSDLSIENNKKRILVHDSPSDLRQVEGITLIQVLLHGTWGAETGW